MASSWMGYGVTDVKVLVLDCSRDTMRIMTSLPPYYTHVEMELRSTRACAGTRACGYPWVTRGNPAGVCVSLPVSGTVDDGTIVH